MVGVRLTWNDLTADNGLDNFARPVKGSRQEKAMLVRKAKQRRAKLWKAWKKGEITPGTCEELAGMCRKESSG